MKKRFNKLSNMRLDCLHKLCQIHAHISPVLAPLLFLICTYAINTSFKFHENCQATFVTMCVCAGEQ